jgi:hypothetical protein
MDTVMDDTVTQKDKTADTSDTDDDEPNGIPSQTLYHWTLCLAKALEVATEGGWELLIKAEAGSVAFLVEQCCRWGFRLIDCQSEDNMVFVLQISWAHSTKGAGRRLRRMARQFHFGKLLGPRVRVEQNEV